MTVYALSREIDPENPQRAERSIYRWLAGDHMPSLASRDVLADALSVDRETLEPDEDDEAHMADLGRRWRDLVREAIT
jgi:hypothetical protein